MSGDSLIGQLANLLILDAHMLVDQHDAAIVGAVIALEA